jgi:hypothetical protein
MNGSTSRKNPHQSAIALGHKDGADAVTHMLAGLSYCRARGKRAGFRFLTMSDMFLTIRPCVAERAFARNISASPYVAESSVLPLNL